MNKKVKIAKDLPPPKKLSKEDYEKINKEAREMAASISKPKIPGEYEIDPNKRGTLTKHICGVCKSKIEMIFSRKHSNPNNPIFGPAGQHQIYWSLDKYRCTNCKLVYDF